MDVKLLSKKFEHILGWFNWTYQDIIVVTMLTFIFILWVILLSPVLIANQFRKPGKTVEISEPFDGLE